MEERSIAAIAYSCADLFNKSLADAHQPDEAMEKKTAPGLVEFLDTQSGRFRIWAASIGVFASEHASLDYRLRESATVKELLLGQILGLETYLKKGNSTFRFGQPAS